MSIIKHEEGKKSEYLNKERIAHINNVLEELQRIMAQGGLLVPKIEWWMEGDGVFVHATADIRINKREIRHKFLLPLIKLNAARSRRAILLVEIKDMLDGLWSD